MRRAAVLLAAATLGLAVGACDVDGGGDLRPDPSAPTTAITPTTGADGTGTTAAGGDADAGDLGAAAPAPALDDPEEAALAAGCEEGDLAACDRLYLVTAIGSEGEAYGTTCGGRTAEEMVGTCETTLGGGSGAGSGSTDDALGPPGPPPTVDDARLAAVAQGCFDGDMAACDDLWRTTAPGSPGEAYGRTCGGRLSEADAAPNRCEARYGAAAEPGR